MPRTPAAPFTPSPEADAALLRLTRLAHAIGALLAGDPESGESLEPASPLAAALAMGMIYFVVRLDPADVRALHVGPGSLGELPRAPLPPVRRGRSPLARLFPGNA